MAFKFVVDKRTRFGERRFTCRSIRAGSSTRASNSRATALLTACFTSETKPSPLNSRAPPALLASNKI